MAQIIEAIYSNGMLKILGDLPLEDQQRVRLTVEKIDEATARREAAVARFKAGVEQMSFRSRGPLPSRDDRQEPGEQPTQGEILAALRRSPLVGVELDLSREAEDGRQLQL